MDPRTRAIYESQATHWIANRGVDAAALRHLRALDAELRADSLVADLGCGPGWFAERLRRRGHRVVGLDLTPGMLREAKRATPKLRAVRGDLARLPFARGSLNGAWAKNSYIHLPMRQLPAALADLHRALKPGAPVVLSFLNFDEAQASARERTRGFVEIRQRERMLRGRLFTTLARDFARDLFEGAGFREIEIQIAERTWVHARRAHTLPDFVRPDLETLVVGLNPSPVAAATGVAFAGANNRFWPAAIRAGWLERDRDPLAALKRGIGFTDIAKRVTRGASEIRPREYLHGIARVSRLVRALRPRSVVFVGLDGYRRALDPRARAGWIEAGFAGRPAYLAPSSSGRNAAASLAELVRHFRLARKIAK